MNAGIRSRLRELVEGDEEAARTRDVQVVFQQWLREANPSTSDFGNFEDVWAKSAMSMMRGEVGWGGENALLGFVDEHFMLSIPSARKQDSLFWRELLTMVKTSPRAARFKLQRLAGRGLSGTWATLTGLPKHTFWV